MRSLVATFALLVALASCAFQTDRDPGSLMIRCPDSRGAISVSDGQVLLAGASVRVAADLRAPTSVDEGLTFAIEVQGPSSSTGPSPSIECVRVLSTQENTQWDAVPRRIEEFRDGSNARVRATGRDGPHWRTGELADVTVWLKIESGRYVVTLPQQTVHTGP